MVNLYEVPEVVIHPCEVLLAPGEFPKATSYRVTVESNSGAADHSIKLVSRKVGGAPLSLTIINE